MSNQRKTFVDSSNDNDSGIGLDRESELNSSRLTLAETNRPVELRRNAEIFLEFPFDGICQRVRPIDMKNNENGDLIFCRTARGSYIAYRTAIVPRWVTDLVQQIEREQR